MGVFLTVYITCIILQLLLQDKVLCCNGGLKQMQSIKNGYDSDSVIYMNTRIFCYYVAFCYRVLTGDDRCNSFAIHSKEVEVTASEASRSGRHPGSNKVKTLCS